MFDLGVVFDNLEFRGVGTSFYFIIFYGSRRKRFVLFFFRFSSFFLVGGVIFE